MLLPAALAIIKVSRHSKPDSQEAKGNHLTDVSTKKCCFWDSQTKPVMVQKTTSPGDDLRELNRNET